LSLQLAHTGSIGSTALISDQKRQRLKSYGVFCVEDVSNRSGGRLGLRRVLTVSQAHLTESGKRESASDVADDMLNTEVHLCIRRSNAYLYRVIVKLYLIEVIPSLVIYEQLEMQ